MPTLCAGEGGEENPPIQGGGVLLHGVVPKTPTRLVGVPSEVSSCGAGFFQKEGTHPLITNTNSATVGPILKKKQHTQLTPQAYLGLDRQTVQVRMQTFTTSCGLRKKSSYPPPDLSGPGALLFNPNTSHYD
jgi:hypothetical protein